MHRIFFKAACRLGFQAVLLGVSFSTVTTEARADSSGIYISRLANAVDMLQLVETPDHRITGQLQAVIHTAGGNLENDSYEVSGAAAGPNISLTLKLNALLSDPVTESGTFDGSTLELIGRLGGNQPGTLVFVKSNSIDFLVATQAVQDQAQHDRVVKAAIEAQQKQEKQRQDFIAATNRLISRMQHFEAASDALLPKFPKVEQQYHAISTSMYTYYNRERSLAGNQSAGMTRGQIAVAISQASVTTDQIHNQVQVTQLDFESNIVPLAKQADTAKQSCQAAYPPTSDNPVPPADEERNSVCLRLRDADSGFRQAYDATAKSLVAVDAVYHQEHEYQQELVTASSQID